MISMLGPVPRVVAYPASRRRPAGAAATTAAAAAGTVAPRSPLASSWPRWLLLCGGRRRRVIRAPTTRTSP